MTARGSTALRSVEVTTQLANQCAKAKASYLMIQGANATTSGIQKIGEVPTHHEPSNTNNAVDKQADYNQQKLSAPSKGKTFRGGSKQSRDNWYGYDRDKGFVRWWHRQGKQEFGGDDIENAEEAKSAYEYWIQMGKPTPK